MRASALFLILALGCKLQTGEVCEDSSDCASERCVAVAASSVSQCVDECPCEEGFECASSVCYPSCANDRPCEGELVCNSQSLLCLPRCESDNDCAFGTTCQEEQCLY